MENMKIVVLSGGLGNQLFQYAFTRLLETQTQESCILENSFFYLPKDENSKHGIYGLERIFGLKLNLLSNHFSEDVWTEMIEQCKRGISIPQQLLNNGINLTMMAEFPDHPSFSGNIVHMPPNAHSKEILMAYVSTTGNFYYHGYWVRPEIVNYVLPLLRKELTFPKMDTVQGLPAVNLKYARQIEETDSVAVHIRRGDFVQIGRSVTPEKYARAVMEMERRHPMGTYFVFSDDISWCKEHKEELGLADLPGGVVFVTGNAGNDFYYVDFWLMTKCKKMIISNSSFGIWAYFLNTTPGLDAIQADTM